MNASRKVPLGKSLNAASGEQWSIVEEPPAVLPEYAGVPIAFEVRSRLRVEPIRGGRGGFTLVEEAVDPPYLKDYDRYSGEGPARWLKRWDLSNWGVLSACDGARRVGGAVIAWRTPGLNMLEERDEIAALWDLRVHPEYRGRGVGSRLFDAVVSWARTRRCRWLKVETQNINVPACRFYARQGCELAAIDRYAYPDLPDEIQLIWRRAL